MNDEFNGFRNEGGQYMWRVGQEKELKLIVVIENEGEDAHEATLTVALPKFMEYRGTDNEVDSWISLWINSFTHFLIVNNNCSDNTS